MIIKLLKHFPKTCIFSGAFLIYINIASPERAILPISVDINNAHIYRLIA